ncbi:MAG: SIMPL domain-containing protein [Janthinobacterium lividum]
MGSAWILSNAARQFKNAENSIEVKGYTERSIESDQSSWSLTLTANEASLSEASLKFDHHKKILIDFLAKEGIDVKDFEGSPLKRNTVYKILENGQTSNQVEGYKISQNFSYRSHNIPLVTSLAIKSGVLITEEGLDLDIGTPRYFYSSQKLESLKLAMIGDATANGRGRAETFALNGGIKIGALKGARQGLFQVTAMDAADVSDYGVYDTSSVQKMVKVVVTLTYAVH